MTIFLIGLAILIGGGLVYGTMMDKIFGPDDRPTPAITHEDGVDYVPMSLGQNSLIQLLNIAGTGPILGPIQGILFGPVALITIPIGCVIAGATHDYFVGMISNRNEGAQMPRLVNKYLGGAIGNSFLVIICLLLLLTGTVFIYTPGDLIVNDLLGMDVNSSIIWVVYGLIFLYYIVATVFPIDEIIGKVYPIFGAMLIISAAGVLIGIFMDGGVNLHSFSGAFIETHPDGSKFIPVFFITVACGILSGFHSSQSTLISRTLGDERQGKMVFYNMMIMEGLIAMAWAAGAMVIYNRGLVEFPTNATLMVGEISREFMGKIGGLFAIIGVIVLPITSGDTSFRSLRLIIAEHFNLDQSRSIDRIKLSIVIFIPAMIILAYAKISPGGFNILWRYFGFTNQLVAIFGLAMATAYLKINQKNFLVTLIPGMFYAFVVFSYISSASIGLSLPMNIAYIIGAVMTVVYTIVVTRMSDKQGRKLNKFS